MGNLFSGLAALGLGKLSNMDVYENEDKKEEKKDADVEKAAEVSEADLIFDKTYDCPVCGGKFKAKTVKTGKVKLIAADSDLRPKYQLVDSLKYDVIACTYCG